jgi:hypothetical protein
MLHRFQQKSLLVNVNLIIWSDLSKAKVNRILFEILPLIESIKAIRLFNVHLLPEFPQIATTMLARARILKISRLAKRDFWQGLISIKEIVFSYEQFLKSILITKFLMK